MDGDMPQNGHLYLKYAYTLFFCVNRTGGVGTDGCVWSFRTREPIRFHGLDGFLREMDLLLGEAERSGCGMEHRHLMSVRALTPAVQTEMSACQTPCSHIRRESEHMRDEMRKGFICVAPRRDDSVQGEARFFDWERGRIPFQSALELRQILREWLTLRSNKADCR